MDVVYHRTWFRERTVTPDSNTDDYVLELLTVARRRPQVSYQGSPIQDAIASGVSSHLAPLAPRMIRAVDQHVDARVQLANALRHPEVPKNMGDIESI